VDTIDSEDARYCFTAGKFKDCYDCIHNGVGLELGYETFTSVGYNLLFNRDSFSLSTTNLLYCSECNGVADCFGCVGLHNKEQYCIFNKQYSKNDYEILTGKIIEHMMQIGEWGEFFPIQISSFGYNETIAYEYFPVTKEKALAREWKWHEEEVKNFSSVVAKDKDILLCEVSGKPYKIIPQELKFYKEHNLPLPRKCPRQRHQERMALRHPRKLWNRTCAKCNASIQTTYAPGRPEIVYCEACYLKEVY